jgi:lipoyl(octanoyl) transferase
MRTRECHVIPVGRLDYGAAWDWQRRLAADRSAGRCGDTLLLLEHPPTITLGRAADRSNILISPDELARRGVALVESDRGGDVTYHAPGQLVGYPILKLSRYGGGLLRYLRGLEETLIRVLASYGIVAGRVPDLTGVWVRTTDAADAEYDAKIAAIGVRLSASGITSHGFALNVAPDLRGFEQIIPCGIRHRRVTSLEYMLGSAPPLEEVAGRVIAQFAEVFEARLLIEEQTWLNLSP